MIPLTIAYTPEYLDWQLGAGHPTNPERARIAVAEISVWAADAGVSLRTLTPRLDWQRVLAELTDGVHTVDYLRGVREGISSEWSGTDQRLSDVAALMFLGTADLAAQIQADGYVRGVYFNPQGAKHHAHAERSSGFCVLNDMAWAARAFVQQGKRVVYVDWDAHHGDGVEHICQGERDILTVSIHDRTIFPGTGQQSRPEQSILNFPLERGAGDVELDRALTDAFDVIEAFDPHVVLVACGADGLRDDPLSTLRYSLDGIAQAARRVGAFASAIGAPVLVGGAGGYQPLTQTPRAWAITVREIHNAISSGRRTSPGLD